MDNEESYTCETCNIIYKNWNEYRFHRHVVCPNIIKEYRGIFETRCLRSKKDKSCFRCGRYGHYYKQRECYATHDNEGILITWGTKTNPPGKFINHRNNRFR